MKIMLPADCLANEGGIYTRVENGTARYKRYSV